MSADPLGSNEGTLPFRPGDIFAGKYEVERVIGQGGMGIVLAARHIALDQKVAIKLLLPSAMAIPGAAQRFLREARSAVAIQSEHVARVIDVGTVDGGPPFMVMEFLTGSDLGVIVRQTGALPVTTAVDYVLQASEAIAEAHARGIIHRDLKPDNIFLTQRADGSALVKVLDFGLSKPANDDRLGGPTPSLTATNLVAGSPQYMSPEQVRGLKNADHRTDVWAIGVILYELITGRRPFEAETVSGVLAKIAADPPLSPRALRADLPSALEATILRCLEKDVSRRMRDVAELAVCLQPFAPPSSQTSIERIERLAVSGRAVSTPRAAPSSEPDLDSLEAELPTMAAPIEALPVPQGASPMATPLPSSDSSRAATSPSKRPPPRPPPQPPTPQPSRPRAVPPARKSSPTPERRHFDLDFRASSAPHPAARGRTPGMAPVGASMERTSSVPVGDLDIWGPLRLLGLAVLIVVLDMVATRMLGSPVSVGPVRPAWLAGPLAIVGAVWLVMRVTRR